MSAIILDGRKVRDEILPELKVRVMALGEAPTLAIIQVGDRTDSASYLKAKKNFGEKIGIKIKHIQIPELVPQKDVVDLVNECNADKNIRGIIVQLPLPLGLDKDAIIDTILPEKDVDALTSVNVKNWFDGSEDAILPATARGIRTLLKYYKIDLVGKKVTVIGRSNLVGKPIALTCLNENATVTVCHSKTPDLAKETKEADIVISVAGKPGLIGKDHVKTGQIIIDVGINTIQGQKLDDEIPGNKLVGDVNFDAIKEEVKAITPVPGGVGPMTVVSLFENLLDLCER